MIKPGYKFDEVARSERYFTSFILPLLLSHDNFSFLKQLFIKLFNEKLNGLKDDFEIVTELDPLRDGSVLNNVVKAKFKQLKRVAVPDIFLRWDKKIIVIEAKFFTTPKKEELEEQLSDQKKAINEVVSETVYNPSSIKYFALAVKKYSLTGFESFTWDDIVEWAESSITNPPAQITYALKVLKNAISRAKSENLPGKYNWKKYSLEQIIKKLPEFLDNGNIYVAFSEGEGHLNTMKLDDLKNRSHYKVSEVRISDNWLTIDQLIKRYIEVKYYTEND